MPRVFTGIWQGGRSYRDRHGRERWVIERMYMNERFSRTLKANSIDEAKAELALFERSPAAYKTAREAKAEALEGALVVNEATVEKVRRHLLKLCTPKYVKDTMTYLGTWTDDLRGRDIRSVKLKELHRILASHPTARAARTAALKTFTAFYREKEATLEVQQDPTIALMMPGAKVARAKREVGYPVEVLEKLYASVYDWTKDLTAADPKGRRRQRGSTVAERRVGFGDPQSVRDYLLLRIKLGMHQTEIERLAMGQAALTPVDHPEIKGTIEFWHKNQVNHIVSVDAQGWAAAQRMHERKGVMSDGYMRSTVWYACERAGIGQVLPGNLRHSFVTIASARGRLVRPHDGGVDLSVIAGVVGHIGGTRTTAIHYHGAKVPVMITIPVSLLHPEDPRR